MVNLKSKKIKYIICALLVLCVAISAFVMVLNNKKLPTFSRNSLTQQDNQYVGIYKKMYKTSDEELLKMYDYFNDWTKVGKELLRIKNELPDERINELYEKGLSFKDFKKAEYYASLSKFTAEEIIDRKIKHGSWKKVVNEYKIDTRPPYQKLGLGKKEIRKLNKYKLTSNQLTQIALLKINQAANVNHVLELLDKGQDVEKIISKYRK